MSNKSVIFICGGDDYLIDAKGKEAFAVASQGIEDEFAKEIIEGFAQNVSDVEAALGRFRDAVQTLSLFGDKKVVWLRGANFLADSKTGKAESTKKAVTDWQAIIETLDVNSVEVIITASPVDRRTKEFKWFQKNTDCHFIDDKKDDGAFKALVDAQCKKLNIVLGEAAWQALSQKVGGHSRMIVSEVDKLAAYLGREGAEITPQLVMDMVPDFGEGDFFEAAEAFYSLDLEHTLEAIKKYFFIHKESRPLLASLQNRNRLLIQLKSLLDAKKIKLGFRGLDKAAFESAKLEYQEAWDNADEKSGLNIFTQNLWYLGKLAEVTTKLTLKQLIDFQLSFVWCYQELLKRPQEQESVIRSLAIKCLG